MQRRDRQHIGRPVVAPADQHSPGRDAAFRHCGCGGDQLGDSRALKGAPRAKPAIADRQPMFEPNHSLRGPRFISTTRPLSSLMMIPEHNRSSACSANEDRHLKLRAATHVTKPGCCNPALLLFEIAGTVSSLLVFVDKSTIFPPKSI